MDEIERFDPATFVGRLLGRGDWKGYGVKKKIPPLFSRGREKLTKEKKKTSKNRFVDRMAEVAPEGKDQEALMDAISKGHFTLRTMYDQLANLQKLGPVRERFGDTSPFFPPICFLFLFRGPPRGARRGRSLRRGGGTNSNLIKKKPENPRNR